MGINLRQRQIEVAGKAWPLLRELCSLAQAEGMKGLSHFIKMAELEAGEIASKRFEFNSNAAIALSVEFDRPD